MVSLSRLQSTTRFHYWFEWRLSHPLLGRRGNDNLVERKLENEETRLSLLAMAMNREEGWWPSPVAPAAHVLLFSHGKEKERRAAVAVGRGHPEAIGLGGLDKKKESYGCNSGGRN